jgi:PAS domain S-box-containing protein
VTVQKTASQYARSLLEASLDPLVTISPEGKITDVNEATIKVTGVLREKLVGTDFSNYFTVPEQAREGYQQVFAQGSVTDYPLTICHEDGRLTDVLYNASVYRDARGNVLGVFAAARDVTAQKRAEAEIAEQRNKELERLAELERFKKLTVGRELKMIELKKEIAELKRQLSQSAAE